MEWYEEEVRARELLLRQQPPATGLVVFYGSSSMRMWGSLKEDFPGLGLLNQAFGGSTLEACAHFFERLVVPCYPRALVCYAGDNDLGDGRTPEQVLASFGKLLAQVDAYFPAIPFTMLGIKPSPARWHLRGEIEAVNAAVCRELQPRANGHFVATCPAMLGADGLPDPSLFLEDGLHVSPKGYRVWRLLLESRCAEVFGAAGAPGTV